jgi:2'-5' RNA ligase
VRCFIALPLPEDAREELAKWAAVLRRELEKGVVTQGHRLPVRLSWARSEGYHLTLAFLGEIEGPAIDVAAASLDAVSGSGDIPFVFDGLGGFPGRGAWRVLFARIADQGRSVGLHARVNLALAELAAAAGIPALNPEWAGAAQSPGDASRRAGRGFEAHVTLARAGSRGIAGIPAVGTPSPGPGGWTIKRCSLFKSELKGTGAVYTELRGVDLS